MDVTAADARVVVEAAPAKVNLTLHVAAPARSGLHPLASLVTFAPGACDRLQARPADALSLRIEGPFAAGLAADGSNLVLMAAQALARHGGLTQAGAELVLDKQLPVASGIGGGSADAAAALRALNRLWDLRATLTELEAVAEELGSDVPACVQARTCWMEGMGERLRSGPVLPPLPALLVNPNVACPTGPVYAAYDQIGRFGSLTHPDLPEPELASTAALAGWLARTRNDLEVPAVARIPAIGTCLAALRSCTGALLVRMSGSGATCFAIFASPDQRDAAASLLAAQQPAWWIAPTVLGDGR